MALDSRLGVSYLDRPDLKRRQQGQGRVGTAVQMLALQLPRILGAQALAPSRLLMSPGSAGPTGLAGTSPVGPRPSALADSIASSVLQEFGRVGQAGVGTDLVSRTGIQPSLPQRGDVSSGFQSPSQPSAAPAPRISPIEEPRHIPAPPEGTPFVPSPSPEPNLPIYSEPPMFYPGTTTPVYDPLANEPGFYERYEREV